MYKLGAKSSLVSVLSTYTPINYPNSLGKDIERTKMYHNNTKQYLCKQNWDNNKQTQDIRLKVKVIKY